MRVPHRIRHDRVVTTTTTWMGLTFLCARCHDHKYDPIGQDDFYSFFSFFNNVLERGMSGFTPVPGSVASSPSVTSLNQEIVAAKGEKCHWRSSGGPSGMGRGHPQEWVELTLSKSTR